MNRSQTAPLLSILVPTWNRVGITARAVRSAGPDRGEVEIVVVDNGSPEGVYADLAAALSPHGNVRLSRNDTNLGMVRNWNRCIALARGTWMGLVCSDDEYLPDGVSRALDLLRSLRDPSLVIQDPGIRGDFETAPAGPETVRTLRLPTASGNFWHRGVTDALGGFDERFEYSADAEFWYRVAARFPVVKVREPFARYNQHEENYMWATWEKENFLEQTRLLARTVLGYRLGEDPRNAGAIERLADDGIWQTLITILRHTFLARDRKALFRRYFPIARERANTPARKADLALALAVGALSRARKRLAAPKPAAPPARG